MVFGCQLRCEQCERKCPLNACHIRPCERRSIYRRDFTKKDSCNDPCRPVAATKKLAFQWNQLIAKSIHICQDLSSSSSSSCSHVSISGHRAAKRRRIFILSAIRFSQVAQNWKMNSNLFEAERDGCRWSFATIFLYRYSSHSELNRSRMVTIATNRSSFHFYSSE